MVKIINKTEKFFRRFTFKVYNITKSKIIYLWLLNFCTKLFYDLNNSISYDRINNLYWHKSYNIYWLGINRPEIGFSKDLIFKDFSNIYCFNYKLQKGDVIVDIGAGIGSEIPYYNELLKCEGLIYSIEANPLTFKVMNLLINKNEYSNVKAFNMAISDNDGLLWIENSENYKIAQTNRKGNGFEVRALTLDEFVKENKIKTINFLKVNIEGSEYEIVDGMKMSISIVKNVAISCHDFLKVRDGNIRQKIIDFLLKNGFEITERNTSNKIIDSWIYGKNQF